MGGTISAGEQQDKKYAKTGTSKLVRSNCDGDSIEREHDRAVKAWRLVTW